MYESNLGSKVNLLGVCIRFDFGCINEYEFWTHEIQSWLELIKMLRSFSYKDQQNILLKLKGKFIHYFFLLFKKVFSNKGGGFLVIQGN